MIPESESLGVVDMWLQCEREVDHCGEAESALS
jgi:hypothetical protein